MEHEQRQHGDVSFCPDCWAELRGQLEGAGLGKLIAGSSQELAKRIQGGQEGPTGGDPLMALVVTLTNMALTEYMLPNLITAGCPICVMSHKAETTRSSVIKWSVETYQDYLAERMN